MQQENSVALAADDEGPRRQRHAENGEGPAAVRRRVIIAGIERLMDEGATLAFRAMQGDPQKLSPDNERLRDQ